MLSRFLPANKWARWSLITGVILLAVFAGLWQIDMVRQYIRIGYMSMTGHLWKLHGTTRREMVRSDALDQTRLVTVYLPPGYDAPANRNRRYPVFYLIHGFPDPGNGWAQFGLAPQLVDESIVHGSLPPMIVVMPDSHGAIGEFGDGEYLDAPMGKGKPGTKLATFVVRDILTWTDAHFRTVPTPAGRFIGGESTGGYGAVNLGLQHPEVFGTMLSLSGYFDADLDHFGRALWTTPPDPARVRAESPLEYVPDAPAAKRDLWRHQFIYLGNGLRDYRDVRDDNNDMARVLDTAGIPNAHHLLPGRHSWDQWRITLVDSLETVRDRLTAAESTGPEPVLASPSPMMPSSPSAGSAP